MKTTDILALPSRGYPRLVGDAEGLFLFCHQVTAEYLARRLGHVRLLEICCGVGALTVAFSKEAQVVFAVDSDPLRLQRAGLNLETYGNPDRVKFRHGDALSEALWLEARPEVVFVDPDWAKPGESKANHTPDLAKTQPPVPEILKMARNLKVPGIVLRLSPASDMSRLAEWEPYELERIFVDGFAKYWLVYVGSVCQRPGASSDLQLFNSPPVSA